MILFSLGRARAAVLTLVAVAASTSLACSVRIATFGSSNDSGGPSAGGGGGGGVDSPYGSGGGDTSVSACGDAQISVDRELLVRDAHVTDGAQADSATDDAAISFRSVVTSLAGGEARASAFTQAWLDSWTTRTLDGTLYGAAVVPRPAVSHVLACPWLRLRPENVCDDTCGTCRERIFDMKKAPFRLVAVVNRLDLGLVEGPCGGVGAVPENAEIRLVFTAVRPGTRDPLPFTLIAEYGAGAHSRGDILRLARTLHEIAALPSGARYEEAVATFVRPFVRGGSLEQIRTNEIAFGAPSGLPWELREFHLGAGAAGVPRLVPSMLTRTPDLSFDGSPALSSWLGRNGGDVVEGAAWTLPEPLQAATAWTTNANFTWEKGGVGAVADGVLASFNRATCNGCHGGLALSPESSFQHLATGSADANGSVETRASAFLTTELLRRGHVLSALLCGEASPSSSPPSTPSTPYGSAR